MHTSICINVEIMFCILLAHTHSECFFGPVAVTDDDGIGAAHGADALQTRASTHGHSGHSKVLNTQHQATTNNCYFLFAGNCSGFYIKFDLISNDK